MVKIAIIPILLTPDISINLSYFSLPKNKFLKLSSITSVNSPKVSIYSIRKSIILVDNIHNLSKPASPSNKLFNSIK